MPSQQYEVLDHTADLAVRVRGRTLEDLFAAAAAAMFAQMCAVPPQTPLTVERQVSVEGADNETLLVAWLSELLYLREMHGEAYVRFDVLLPAAGRLEAVVAGVPWQRFERPVKAVTYHGLRIRRTAQGYTATIVFDV